MKKVADFMDYAIRSKWIENDAMIAVKVGVAAATVSRWRDGSRIPEDDEALVLAEVLMANPDELLPCVRYWKAKLPETKQVWERLAKIAAAAAVVVAVTPHNTYASTSQYAPCIPGITVFRTARASAARALASLSIRFRRIFQQCGTVRFDAVAH